MRRQPKAGPQPSLDIEMLMGQPSLIELVDLELAMRGDKDAAIRSLARPIPHSRQVVEAIVEACSRPRTGRKPSEAMVWKFILATVAKGTKEHTGLSLARGLESIADSFGEEFDAVKKAYEREQARRRE